MASNDEAADTRKLTGSADVSAKLLLHVSYHVRPKMRAQFATGALGMKDTEYELLEEDFPQNAKRRNFEVLKIWYRNAVGVQVKEFIELLVKWQKKGFISHRVWEEVGDYVRSELLPVPIPTAVPPCGSDTEMTPSGRELTLEDKLYIKRQLKVSLRRRCRNALSTDWLTQDKARSFPLRDYYTGLQWKKKIKRAMRDIRKDMNRIHDIFDVEVADGAVNIAVIGKAGIGKSSFLAILASDWVECDNQDAGVTSKLDQFDFVFLIELRYVNDNSTLEQIIMKQHGLKAKDISESQIRSILRGRSGGKVLLMFDGYDEYQKGTNDDIDAALEDTIGDCFLILTSRDGDYISKDILNKLDGELEITGLSDENIRECAAKYLGSHELAEDMFEKAKTLDIYDLLNIPIILLMVCILYHTEKTLPSSLTQIVNSIVFMCIDRSTMKHFGKKAKDIVGLENLLFRLGELSLKALQSKTRQLLLSKNEVQEISEDLLKLGLLHGSLYREEASLEEEPDVWLMFPHKLFQEFTAAYFASRKLSLIQVLPFDGLDWSLQNVTKFTYGLAEDPSVVIDDICRTYVDGVTKIAHSRLIDRRSISLSCFILQETLRMCFKKRPDRPVNLYNDAICYMNKYVPRPDKPSRFYYFKQEVAKHVKTCDIDVEIKRRKYDVTSCIIFMEDIPPEDLHKLLEACANMNQPVQSLYISTPMFIPVFRFPDEAKRPMKCPQFTFLDNSIVELRKCDFASMALETIMDSIQTCTSLRKLSLYQCQNIPKQLLASLGQMTELQYVRIEKCKLTPTADLAALLLTLSLRPLEILRLDGIPLTGKISEACKSSEVSYGHLKELSLTDCSLCEEDILALTHLVQEDKLPKLRELDLRDNDFRFMPDTLQRLLETCD